MARCCHLKIIANVALTKACPRLVGQNNAKREEFVLKAQRNSLVDLDS